MLPLGDRLVNLRQAAFSRDGARLAVLIAAGTSSTTATAMSLLIAPTAGGPATPLTVNGRDVIAANSGLEWTPDGQRVIVSMRSLAREQEAARRFKSLIEGPIVVHSSKEPFLEWDDLNRANRWRTLVEIDLATGHPTERLAERKLTNYRVSRDGIVRDLSGRRDREDRLRHDRRQRESPARAGRAATRSQRRCSRPKTSRASRRAGRMIRDGSPMPSRARSSYAHRRRRRTESDEKERDHGKKKTETTERAPVLTPDEKKEAERAESFSVESFSRDGVEAAHYQQERLVRCERR